MLGGYVLCGILYAIAAIPLFFFPKSLLEKEEKATGAELQPLRHDHHYRGAEHEADGFDEHEGWSTRLTQSMRGVYTLIGERICLFFVVVRIPVKRVRIDKESDLFVNGNRMDVSVISYRRLQHIFAKIH